MSQAYFALDEREIGCESARRLLSELRDTGTKDAEYKARLLKPMTSDERPEQLWIDFHRALPELIAVIETEARRGPEDFAEIEIELLPAEVATMLQAQPCPRGNTAS